MVNSVFDSNPSNDVQVTINTKGSNFLWAVFAVMLLSDLVMIVWSFTLPKGRRTFHVLSYVILTTASVAYFSMASNLGYTPVLTEFNPAGVTRSIWYARYIDWVITTPCLLLELLLATGLPLSDIFATIFMDLVMIITGLIGALIVSQYKWGFFAFGCAAEIYIWWILLGPAYKSSQVLGPEFKKAYIASAAILSFLWMLYPVCWGLADGANVISPDAEMIFYGVLDVLAKPVFIFYHIWAVSRLDYTRLQLQSGKFSEGASLLINHNELNNIPGNSIHAKNARADQGAADPRISTSTAVNGTHSVI